MALNIDGQHIETNFKGIGNSYLMSKIAEFMEAKYPFRLYSHSHRGLIVNPHKMMCFDRDNDELTTCDNAGQLQWILQCSMIVYDQIEPIQQPHVIEFVKKCLEL